MDRYTGELSNLKYESEDRFNLFEAPNQSARITELSDELTRLMKETGLTPENDKMPIDEGIKQELPDAKIR